MTTTDGQVYEKVEDSAIAYQYPTREEILSKFWDQVDAYQSVSRAKAQKILDMIDHIEDVKQMKEYTKLLMPLAAGAALAHMESEKREQS